MSQSPQLRIRGEINIPFPFLTFPVVTTLSLIYICVGHAILRNVHLPGYAHPIRSSAIIGAVGGVVMAVPIALLGCPFDQVGYLQSGMSLAFGTAVGAASGALGVTILSKAHVHENMLNVTHAARAGALGGAIIGLSLFVALLVLSIFPALRLRWKSN